jgi:glyoxylase-like metal-dependent hydrolase (beta-lactamase superfamily II)
VLLRSIRERLLTLPPETRVFTGHGPSTTVGYERENNPFLDLDERTLLGLGGGDGR